MPEFNRIVVIGKREPLAQQCARDACRFLAQQGLTVFTDVSNTEELAGVKQGIERKNLPQDVDLVVVVGGDGTLLNAGRRYSKFGTPMLGVNQGRLGFMVDVAPEKMIDTLQDVLCGEYMSESRMILEATLHRQGETDIGMIAVNDFVLRNQAAVRMIEFETWYGDEFISVHRADGMIVSSPTGSTAYALSGGGPVLHPMLDAIVMVPICPHTLTDRPFVIGTEKSIKMVMKGDDTARTTFTGDGQLSEELRRDDYVEIRRSDKDLNLIHPKSYQYFTTLRNKLNWGRERL